MTVNLPRATRALRRSATCLQAPVAKAGAEVSEHRLENGMRILVAERHGDPVVASVLYYRAGARNETEREAGVSHFLEHMMFKGSAGFGKGEVDRVTTELGGQNNAFTGYDHTGYWFEFASDRWERLLDLEVDRMAKLTLDPTEFDAERAVVLEELAMGEDDPWRVLSQIVERTVFPHHPYGRPIIGFTETLEAMSPESMRDYYRRFYHPGNATIVLAGDVKAEDAVRAVEARFGGIEAGVPFEQADSFRPKLKEPLGEVRCGTTWDDPADRMIMAWPTTAVGTQDDYAIDLLMNVLTNGRSSRLWRRLVIEEGLATSVTSVNDSRVEAGAFWLYAEASQGVEPAAVEKVVEEELVRIRDTMCKPEELARARSMILASYAYDGETVSDVAEHLGEWAVDADWRMAFDDGVNYERLTEASLRDTAARFLVPERRVVGWCRPSEE